MERAAGNSLVIIHNKLPSLLVWNNPIGGLVDRAGRSITYTFGNLASSGRFPHGSKIGNPSAFTTSVNAFHDAARGATRDTSLVSLINTSRGTLLKYVRGLANQPYGTKSSISPSRGEAVPEIEEGKYNPSGRAVTRPGAATFDPSTAAPAPLGVKVPFPNAPYKMLYNPEFHRSGTRQKKILREAAEETKPSTIPTEVVNTIMGIRRDVKDAHIPSPKDFIRYMSDESISEKERMQYAYAMVERAKAINQETDQMYQSILQQASG